MQNKLFLLTIFTIFIIVGCSKNPTSPSDNSPSIQWAKCFGGSNDDEAYSIQQTKDGGYIIAGTSMSNDGDVSGKHGDEDYWIIKLSSVGIIEWQRTYGGSNSDVAKSISETNDGGYIVTGYTYSNDGDVNGFHSSNMSEPDYWILKLSSNGAIQWKKTFGGILEEIACSIEQTIDGGYIVAGSSASGDGDIVNHHGNVGDDDFWILKLSSNGDIQWQKSLGGSYSDYAYSIRQTNDMGFIIAGCSRSKDGDVTVNHGQEDYWIVKLNSSGDLQWQKSLGGSNDDEAYSIQQTSDSGYIVAGISVSEDGDVIGNHGNHSIWVVKLSSSGKIQWQKFLINTTAAFSGSIQQTNDGGYVVASCGLHGCNGYDYCLYKLSPSGEIQWQKFLGGSEDDYAYSIQQTNDGGYIIAGRSLSIDGDVTGNHGCGDVWIVKLK